MTSLTSDELTSITDIPVSGTGLCILLGQVGSFLAPYTKLLPHVWMIYVTFTVTTLLGVCCIGSLHETRNIPIISTISELQALYAENWWSVRTLFDCLFILKIKTFSFYFDLTIFGLSALLFLIRVHTTIHVYIYWCSPWMGLYL